MSSYESPPGRRMSEPAPAGTQRMRVLCLLRDGPSDATRRWTAALAQTHEVELVDLARPGLDYAELLSRIFAADRVISW